MNKKEKQELVNKIKEICKDIGCSKVSQECLTNPQNCDILRKVFQYKKCLK
jgi:hypothetical protein